MALTDTVVFTGCTLDVTAVDATVPRDATVVNARALIGEDVMVAADTAVVTIPEALLLATTVTFPACVDTGVTCLLIGRLPIIRFCVAEAVANVFCSRPLEA